MGRDLVIAVIVLLVVVGVAFGSAQVEVRQGAGVLLAANTPAVIGNAAGRVELKFKNDGPNSIACGEEGDTLSLTPGTRSGQKLKSDQSEIRRVFPDRVVRCLDPVGGSIVSYDEALLRTATATATATATPTT
jgi:hypothetical protein